MPPRGLPRRPFFPSLHSDRMARAAVRAAPRLVFEHRPCVKQPGDDDGREPLELRCLRARLAGCQVKNESTGQMLNFPHRTASFALFHFPSKGLKVVSAPPFQVTSTRQRRWLHGRAFLTSTGGGDSAQGDAARPGSCEMDPRPEPVPRPPCGGLTSPSTVPRAPGEDFSPKRRERQVPGGPSAPALMRKNDWAATLGLVCLPLRLEPG